MRNKVVDFIKASLDAGTVARLRTDPRIEFTARHSEDTGEVKEYPKTAHLRNLKVVIRSPDYCELSGSLHRFAKGENYSDFGFDEVAAAVRELEGFGIDIHQTKIRNLEAGANLKALPVTPKGFVREVISHKGQQFNQMRAENRKPIGIEAYHQQYAVKIYDKSVDCKLPYPLMRYEVKFTRMQALSKTGIQTLADLTDQNAMIQLGGMVASKFDELLVSEPRIQPDKLKPAERKRLANYENPRHWQQRKDESARKHDHDRRQYRKLIAKHVSNPLQKQVSEILKVKLKELLSNPKSSTKLTGLYKGKKINQINQLLKTQSSAKLTASIMG